MKLFSVGIAFAIICYYFAVALSAADKPSRVVRFSLANGRLSLPQPDYVIFDPRSKYYLVRSGHNWERLGARLNLICAQDVSKWGQRPFEKRKIRVAKLPDLRTGWGVNIGDSPAQLQHKLGARPDKQRIDNERRTSFLAYYRFVMMRVPRDRQLGGNWKTSGPLVRRRYQYIAQYYFQQGKLREIEYSLVDPDFEC